MPDMQRVDVTCNICGEKINPDSRSMFLHLIENHPLHFLTSRSAPELVVEIGRQAEVLGTKFSKSLFSNLAKKLEELK